MGDQGIAIGEAVRPDAVGYGGGHELLGAAAADAQEKFHCGAVDKGAGEGSEFGGRCC